MFYTKTSFKKALPIWAKGKTKELNCSLIFETKLSKSAASLLRVSGHGAYQIYINGSFFFAGPARAGRGFYRVDELDLSGKLDKEENTVTVIAASYNCSSFYIMNLPGFFIAELEKDGEVFSPTGGDAWKIYPYSERIRKVQRYSFQRTFAEVYRHENGNRLSTEGREILEAEICPEVNFITRDVSYPDFEREAPHSFIEKGKATPKKPESYFSDRAIDSVGEIISGFPLEELEVCSVHRAQELSLTPETEKPSELPIILPENSYVTAEMPRNLTGLITLSVKCKSDTAVYLLFDEILSGGRIDFTRMMCSNVVLYHLKGGESYELVTFEPYTFKYMNIVSFGGEIELSSLGLIRIGFNASEIKRSLNTEKADGEIKAIYEAAVETFRQNTFDIYMDCPSRERAGWLCDSYFTSRVERLLTGRSTVEKAFLSNFAMAESFPYIEDGMLPMCYPSDHPDRAYIPNWAMWFAIELKEYLERTSDRAFVDALKDKMYALLEFFRGFENSDGLLEHLRGWIFIEWSKSNEFVHDISYPTNMLYYLFKLTLAELYSDGGLTEEAVALRSVIREKSRMELFFCDNSVYNEDGEAVLSGNATESCQYYAFFTGIATPSEDGKLWETLVRDFGPKRDTKKTFPEVYPSNAFIGNYLRCEILMKNGYLAELENDIRGYFLYMAERTGTLWENDGAYASCNHGFASNVAVWLDALGYLI